MNDYIVELYVTADCEIGKAGDFISQHPSHKAAQIWKDRLFNDSEKEFVGIRFIHA